MEQRDSPEKPELWNPQLHLPEIYSARPWESVAVIRGMRVFQCADEGVLEDRGRGRKGLAKEESDRIL